MESGGGSLRRASAASRLEKSAASTPTRQGPAAPPTLSQNARHPQSITPDLRPPASKLRRPRDCPSTPATTPSAVAQGSSGAPEHARCCCRAVATPNWTDKNVKRGYPKARKGCLPPAQAQPGWWLRPANPQLQSKSRAPYLEGMHAPHPRLCTGGHAHMSTDTTSKQATYT